MLRSRGHPNEDVSGILVENSNRRRPGSALWAEAGLL